MKEMDIPEPSYGGGIDSRKLVQFLTVDMDWVLSVWFYLLLEWVILEMHSLSRTPNNTDFRILC